MRRGLIGVVLGALIVVGATAAAATSKSAKDTAWTCSLTGQTVQECCCTQQKDGKLYCTLAKRTVDSCCCKAADAEASAKK